MFFHMLYFCWFLKWRSPAALEKIELGNPSQCQCWITRSILQTKGFPVDVSSKVPVFWGDPDVKHANICAPLEVEGCSCGDKIAFANAYSAIASQTTSIQFLTQHGCIHPVNIHDSTISHSLQSLEEFHTFTLFSPTYFCIHTYIYYVYSRALQRPAVVSRGIAQATCPLHAQPFREPFLKFLTFQVVSLSAEASTMLLVTLV